MIFLYFIKIPPYAKMTVEKFGSVPVILVGLCLETVCFGLQRKITAKMEQIHNKYNHYIWVNLQNFIWTSFTREQHWFSPQLGYMFKFVNNPPHAQPLEPAILDS